MNDIWFFLPCILLLGIATTYTDIKNGLIKNKHLLFGLIYGVLVYLLLIFFIKNIDYGYLMEFFIGVLLSLFVGFIVWYSGLWTAGDAKLFFVFSFLIPLSVYNYGYVKYFPQVNLLINIFLPIGVYYLILVIIKFKFKDNKEKLKEVFNLRGIIELVIFVFAVTWPINLVFYYIGIPYNYFTSSFVLLIILLIFNKLFSKYLFWFTILLSGFRIIFDESVYSLWTYKDLGLIVLIILSIRILLILGFSVFTKDVKIKDLKPGMVPAEIVYEEDSKYHKKDFFYAVFLWYIYEKIKDKKKYLFEPMDDGLTRQDIFKLNKFRSKFDFDSLRIQSTIPFATFIFLGVLLTILFKGNFITAIISLLF